MPWTKLVADSFVHKKRTDGKRELSYGEALKEALSQAMKVDERVFVMGEGVDAPRGIFGTTEGLQKVFGKERVFDLPLSENAFTGFAVGSAIAGMRPVLIHMRMDFMLLSMDQIVNHASKWRYMFGGKESVPLTIRCIIGKGWGSGAQHSQSLEGLFMHIPGLKIACPSTAYDAKGLLLSAIAGNDPVIFIEHRWLYSAKCPVPRKPYIVHFGKAVIRKKGKDVTIAAYSLMVREAMAAAEELEKEGISAEVIDLRTLAPLDRAAILDSVKKTGRAVVAALDWKTCGVSSEISSLISEGAFTFLKSPVERVALPDTPTPACDALEKGFYRGKDDIKKAVYRTIKP
ncbi:MAG: pyruvate dehydrogenase complex E1 component subunit beta [Candidatus Omnitrophota bacterium]